MHRIVVGCTRALDIVGVTNPAESFCIIRSNVADSRREILEADFHRIVNADGFVIFSRFHSVYGLFASLVDDHNRIKSDGIVDNSDFFCIDAENFFCDRWCRIRNRKPLEMKQCFC